jgi:hypothetical protein
LTPHLENLRRRSDFHSSVLGQRLITELLTRPGAIPEAASGIDSPPKAGLVRVALGVFFPLNAPA